MPLAPAAVLRAAAGLPGVLAGFAAYLRLGLRPGEGGKALRHAGGFHKVVGDVDKELKSQAEAVFHQPRRKKHRFRGAERGIAMADGAIAEFDGVGGRNHGLAGIGDGQGNEVVGAMGECRRERGRHRAHQAFQVGLGDACLSPRGIMNAVGGGADLNLGGHLFGMPKFDLRAACHETVF